MDPMGMLLVFGPGVIALGCLVGCFFLIQKLEGAEKGVKVLLWGLIAVLALVAFGIGGCYAWLFSGGLRIGG